MTGAVRAGGRRSSGCNVRAASSESCSASRPGLAFGAGGAIVKPLLGAGWSPGAAVFFARLGRRADPARAGPHRAALRPPSAVAGEVDRARVLGHRRRRRAARVLHAPSRASPVSTALLIEYLAPVALVAFAWVRTPSRAAVGRARRLGRRDRGPRARDRPRRRRARPDRHRLRRDRHARRRGLLRARRARRRSGVPPIALARVGRLRRRRRPRPRRPHGARALRGRVHRRAVPRRHRALVGAACSRSAPSRPRSPTWPASRRSACSAPGSRRSSGSPRSSSPASWRGCCSARRSAPVQLLGGLLILGGHRARAPRAPAAARTARATVPVDRRPRPARARDRDAGTARDPRADAP